MLKITTRKPGSVSPIVTLMLSHRRPCAVWTEIVVNLVVFVAVTAVLTGCGAAAEGDNSKEMLPSFFTTMYQEQPVKAFLTVDLDSVIQFKEEELEVEGRLELQLAQPLDLTVEVRSRGVTRKNYCTFPPLRVQLKKAVPAERGWGDYRNYKLVTHCSDSLRDEELLFREYLVYKMYEMLSKLSLRTQLVDMHYISMSGDTVRRHAFLIENEEEMNDRLGLQALDPESSSVKRIHFDHYKRFVLFQYMVGNTDWNLSSGHNTQYVLEPGSETPIVIPYDFDYCGLVNASYARPFPSLPIADVRERYFMYRGKKDDDFTQAVQEFRDLKESWYQVVNESSYLSQASKNDIIGFLDDFFEVIERPDWKNILFPA
jgi:hypothetical protein